MDKRGTLALVLCFAIFIGWMWIQNKIWPPPKPQPAAQSQAPAKNPPVAPPVAPEKTPDKAPDGTPSAAEPAHYVEKPAFTLNSKNLEVVFTNRGAGVERMILHYPKPDDAVTLLRPMGVAYPHLALRQVGGPDPIETLPWDIVEQKDGRAEFKYRLRNGVEITKSFELDAERHTVKLTVMLDNKNPVKEGEKEPPEKDVRLQLLAFNGMDPDNPYRYEQYLMGAHRYDHKLVQKSTMEITKGEGKLAEALKLPQGPERDKEVKSIENEYFRVNGGLKDWIGIKNRFFATVLIPDSAALDAMDYYEYRDLPPQALKQEDGRHNVMVSAVTNPLSVRGSRKVFQFVVYGGTLEKEMLREVPGVEDLGGYTGGCFLAPIVKPAAAIILETLHVVKGLLHNMGFAIIITTLLIRLCLFPLSLKSQRNAMQMQALGPKIQALKERYKDDQQKYGVEQMRLFKENGVNPVAGCLPLFIQMPIFVGMYSVFENAIDLRHAPFIFWIRDLSQPDRLLGPWTPFEIPLILTTVRIDAFNLLPILMTITWFLQAYLTPRSPDPQMAQQQKMMMWMPIVFGMTCYGLASGLSLYFLSNSLLSMAEQRIIKRYILKIGPDGKPLAPPGSVEKK